MILKFYYWWWRFKSCKERKMGVGKKSIKLIYTDYLQLLMFELLKSSWNAHSHSQVNILLTWPFFFLIYAFRSFVIVVV
jgi:hypothetical protein